MKPPRFEYFDPRSVEEALGLLKEYQDEAKVLAGGQSLVPLLNFRLARPRYLIDLNRISTLAYIREWDGGLAIGAMTRQRTVERSPLIQQRCPLLHEVMPYIGHATGAVGGVSPEHSCPRSTP